MNFYIDTMRAIVKNPNLPHAMLEEEKMGLRSIVIGNHGEFKADEKTERYLELDPPNLCVVVEYHEMMRQVESSYVSMDDYPALTGACCLGERILNMLVLKLRSYYKTSKNYKNVYRRESIQDWKLAIDTLHDWDVLQDETVACFNELYSLRNTSVHYESLGDIQPLALRAVQLVMSITNNLFGNREDVFFWCPGELYIRRAKETEPIVQEFFVPNCPLVGYKHTVEGVAGGLRLHDGNVYESSVITDEEFRELRIKSTRTPTQSK